MWPSIVIAIDISLANITIRQITAKNYAKVNGFSKKEEWLFKKRKEDYRSENPQFSTPNRAVLEPILAGLDRLWEMRHRIPNPGTSMTCRTNVKRLVKQ